MTDLRAYARGAANRAGIPPDLFERQIEQESGFDPEAYNAGSGATGIAQIVARYHPDVDPSDPIASLDYAAGWMGRLWRQYGSYRDALAAYNWGPGNVAGWDRNPSTLPAETRRYLDVILGPGWTEPGTATTGGPTVDQLRVTEDGVRLRERPDTSAPILYEARAGELVTPLSQHAWRQVRTGNGRVGWMATTYLEPVQAEIPGNGNPESHPRFDPSTPVELQVQDWTCSIRSTMWMLKSLGIAVTPAEAQDAMSPRYVNRNVGLLDASGAGIVAVLRERWGVEARNLSPASFDDVAGRAGQMPCAIGLRNWGGPGLGHWSAVRGVEGDHLVLANPAGTGPLFGQQTLNRGQFSARGPASLVWVPLG